MAAKPVSTMSPPRQMRNAKPARMTTPLHGAVSHQYGVSTAQSTVAKLNKSGC